VCVIDPLAHNNPAGFPHASRWEDIEEILSSGISVLTAVNLLHVEELRERVEAISGKQTKETVPRRFLAEADEIVVVDAPVSVVLERKQQLSTERRDAQELTHALSEQREMTLVFAAELAERQLERYLEDHDIQQLWGVHERILVCLTPRSNGESMIASGKRNQERFHGELYVVYSHLPHLSKDDKARLDGFLKLSKEAGAQVSMLRGEDPIDAILEFAKKKKVTQIFVGHSRRDDWLSRIWASPLDHLLRGAEHMDVRIFPQ
jgi:two-component system sensor histidine kinase KdpD